MDYLLLHIWPFMVAAALLGLASGFIGAVLAARASARRAAEPRAPRRRGR
ncbi:hypothetical protein LB518_03890 [Mesorhizobium sp. BR1-1-16]|nr:hypothetical protein [Mesorhizobium sp. BR1-1-16]MBZ9935418.1 hypothetical protein [Mesorhizobium sp. BR1-1-16]